MSLSSFFNKFFLCLNHCKVTIKFTNFAKSSIKKYFCMRKTLIIVMFISSMMALNTNAQTNNNKDFKYILDEFADCKVMRYQLPYWDSLSVNQKQYIYYLSQAALWGRDIYFDQNYKHNLQIRKTLEAVLNSYKGDKNDLMWQKFEIYCKRVFFSNGIHHHYGEKKFIPECSQAFVKQIMTQSDFAIMPNKDNLSKEEFIDFIVNEIFNLNIAPIRRDSDSKKDIVQSSSVNFYENITREEVEKYYSQFEVDSLSPVSLGINSKLTKKDGKITETKWTASQMYAPYIQKIIFFLEKAKTFAENDTQKQYTNKLIEFYKTGDLKTWDEYNILWAKDNESVCDYVNGFVETYNDPLGMKGTWESIVDYKDIEATERTKTICDNAQWFEDHSPIKPEYRKKKVKGLSAKVINAAMLSGDCYPTPPIGINLPNADWIRKEYGSKSVTIANLSDAYFFASMENPKSALKEFAYSQKEIEREKIYGQLSDNLHTDMHECLGHGSGQLLDSTNANALSEYSSTLEEARADLFALYYLMDKKMLELKLVPSLETGKAQYNSYIRNGLLVQLARIPYGDKITEAHMQNRKLVCEYALQEGQGCIKRTTKDNKTYFVIQDYDKLREVFGKLLYIIQDIKSRGDYAQGKALVEKYGVNIDKEIHKEVIERYEKLNIKPYGGFVNPNMEIVKDSKGKVLDVKISYPKSFIEQELQYGKDYSFDLK